MSDASFVVQVIAAPVVVMDEEEMFEMIGAVVSGGGGGVGVGEGDGGVGLPPVSV